MLHLKKPQLAPEETDRQVRESIESMLDDIAERGEDAIRDQYASEHLQVVASTYKNSGRY
jgi:hypothetical protein